MTELLVLAGVLSHEILDMIRKNHGVSVYLYDSNFLYGTLWGAYKNPEEKFVYVRRLLSNVDGWDEVIAEQAFLKSRDCYDFVHSLPIKMATNILRGDWVDPILTSLHESVGKTYVVSSLDECLAIRLQNYLGLSSLAFGFPSVGDETIFVTAGTSVCHLGPICGVSHVLVGPGAKTDELEDFKTRLFTDAPVKANIPEVITSDMVIAEGGCKKLYL